MIKLVFVDDQHFIISAFKNAIETQSNMSCLFTAFDGEELFQKLDSNNLPDIIFLDLSMPGMNGIEIVTELRKDYSFVKVIALTQHHEMHQQFLDKGGNGYLLKNRLTFDELIDCIHRIYNGETIIHQERSYIP